MLKEGREHKVNKSNVLYIHGFNSSPLSLKAEQTRLYLAEYFPETGFYCPQLATSPNEAVAQLEEIIKQQSESQWFIVGSSLGGYFASYLAEKYQCLAVLVNPAIKPYELLVDYIGEQVNPYTREVYQVTPDHMEQLQAIEQIKPTQFCQKKNNYLVMVQTADEVLNYQQAVEKYQHCQLVVEAGGDHSFVNFDQQLPKIAQFFNLTDLRLTMQPQC
ncbi:alpha/beta hydrolase [Colwellia sp. D2M02]|uniref:YqiA/YcfP family alpha/beta fold hydrolase n=1 Tax=Colwellia sp. D2M02 TaxID=2841562 RepID=UPI001C09AC3C|nr:YqiA/YcfP family alpha/beta fold hydrolase [Colwellia sp. D2M02]MBU2893390.1 alpha/beta hydrolase [Colwellia sp. D2M02]